MQQFGIKTLNGNRNVLKLLLLLLLCETVGCADEVECAAYRAGGAWLLTDMRRGETIFDVNPQLQVTALPIPQHCLHLVAKQCNLTHWPPLTRYHVIYYVTSQSSESYSSYTVWNLCYLLAWQ